MKTKKGAVEWNYLIPIIMLGLLLIILLMWFGIIKLPNPFQAIK